MPPRAPVPKTVLCSLIFDIGSDLNAVTRFYITYTGTAPTAAQLNTFAALIGTSFGTVLKGAMDTSSSLAAVTCEDLTSSSGAVGSANPAITGTLAGAPMGASTCFVVSYTIGRRYRGGHPRGYWRFGVAADLLTPQQFSAGFAAVIAGDMATFFGDILAGGWASAGVLTQSNVSYFHSFTVVTNPITGRARNVPTPRVGGPLIDTVTAYVGRVSVGSQRRRNQFSG